MNRYRITDRDRPFALEFRRNLESGTWYHSPGLQRVLNVMRGGHGEGKYVLVVREPFRRWVLARMPGCRGAAVEVLEEHEFTDEKEAEWTVFRLRWRELTGKELDV